MPIYDFQCNSCKSIFEIRASIQEKELGLKPKCPTCQSMETRQVLTSGFFVRSGGGNGGSLPSSFCGPNSGSGCCG